MITVEEVFASGYEVKKSKFLAFVVPIALFDETLAKLKGEHPKANHHVWAWRKRNEFGQIVENQSDDGEPKGCAGKPTLAVLRGAELIEAGVITVRYFGGIKLGTGGMVRGYGEAANQVLAQAPTMPWVETEMGEVTVAYPELGKTEYAVGKAGLEITDKRFDAATVTLTLSGEKEDLERFLVAAGAQ